MNTKLIREKLMHARAFIRTGRTDLVLKDILDVLDEILVDAEAVEADDEFDRNALEHMTREGD